MFTVTGEFPHLERKEPIMRALAIRHVAFEDLGLLEQILRDRGYQVEYLDAGVDAVDHDRVVDADLLAVLGGPIGIYDVANYPFLADEWHVLAARLSKNLPTLGICLGAQLMAHALRASVGPAVHKEIGYGPVDLTEAGRESVLAALGDTPVLHWHGDEFEIPDGAVRPAETRGFPNQAFQMGPNILGLQFHLEAQAHRIEQWLVGHSVELAAAGVIPQIIRAAAPVHAAELSEAARRVMTAWLDNLEEAGETGGV